MATFSDILDAELLAKLAGDRSFERGVDYFERGLVHSLAEYGERITAEVSGTETYQVQLWLEKADLMSRCTCPMGVDGWFCKHCVAVALAWIAEPPPYQPDGDAPAKTGTTMEDVRDYLARQERETLVQIILNQAMEDARWRDQLLMKAASHQSGGADINTFRRALRNAITIGDFVDYYAAAGYAEDVQTAVDGLEELLDSGYASDVVELSEDAIDLLDNALGSVDDSNGNLNTILDQVQDLHYRACEIAQPNPRALAERLFHMELRSGYGFFYNAVESYADILGSEGRETYQQLVDAEWNQLPAINRENRHSFDYQRSQLSRMKESLVAVTGSLEELVRVISKDLSEPHRYLRIARLYQEAGQANEAIAWAERGLDAFQESYYTGQLGDFLIAAYEQQSRFEDAIAIVWKDFSRSPTRLLYQKLKHQADKVNAWSHWRDRALTHIKKVTDNDQRPKTIRFGHFGNSLLVEIFIWEEDIDQAWQAAKSGGCLPKLWMQLADLRAAEHPEDALSVYQPAIEPLINATNNVAYLQAVELLSKVRGLMSRLNRDAEFTQLLNTLSTTYKRKRNFIKFLIQEGLIK